MKTYLITGAAGFIGANYLKYILKLHKDIKIVVLDVLTYAGNLGTIKDNIEDAKIHTEILGSDHCPVELDINL